MLPYLPQWRERYARLFRDGDLFLAEGPEMREKVIAAGAPRRPDAIHPIALDLTKYPRWSPDGGRTVLFVGRFVEKKGCSTRSRRSVWLARSAAGRRA